MSPNRRYSPRTHAIVDGDPMALIGEPPTLKLCINQEWIPFLLGALEVLSADDYWENPTVTVPQVEDLIAELGKAIPTTCDTDYHQTNLYWYAVFQPMLTGHSWFLPLSEFSWPTSHFYLGFADFDPVAGIASLDLTAYDFGGGDPAGGKMREMYFEADSNGAAAVWTWTREDCLGASEALSLFQPRIDRVNIEVKHLFVQCSEAFTFAFVIDGDATCLSA